MKEAFVETGHDSSKVMLLGVNIKDSPITTTNLVSKQLPPNHVDIKNSPSTSTNSLQSKQLPPDHNRELDVIHHSHAPALKRIKRGKGILCFSLYLFYFFSFYFFLYFCACIYLDEFLFKTFTIFTTLFQVQFEFSLVDLGVACFIPLIIYYNFIFFSFFFSKILGTFMIFIMQPVM